MPINFIYIGAAAGIGILLIIMTRDDVMIWLTALLEKPIDRTMACIEKAFTKLDGWTSPNRKEGKKRRFTW